LFSWSIDSRSPEQTQALGEALGRLLEPATVVLLSGDLGAGKTSFTQGLGRGLEIPESEPVVSPSYTLMNHYRGRLDLYHFDFYRLVHAEDLLDLGFDEYLCGDGVTVVEWSDRFPELDLEGIRVHLEPGGGECRKIDFSAAGARSLAMLEVFVAQMLAEGEAHDRV
jgi:tRNA threonylcarbamoyladenosine biosynthesis protein TsaE